MKNPLRPLRAQGNRYVLEMFIDDLSKPFDPEWRVKIDGEPPDPQALYSAECCVQELATGKYRIFFLSASSVPRKSFEEALFGSMVFHANNQRRFTDAFCDQLWQKLAEKKDFPIPRLSRHDLDLERLAREGIDAVIEAA